MDIFCKLCPCPPKLLILTLGLLFGSLNIFGQMYYNVSVYTDLNVRDDQSYVDAVTTIEDNSQLGGCSHYSYQQQNIGYDANNNPYYFWDDGTEDYDSIPITGPGTYAIDINGTLFCSCAGTQIGYGGGGSMQVNPVCPSTILYSQSVTPSLNDNNPPYLTGMGIVAVMTGSAGSAGAQISESVSLQSSTCGPNYQINCGGSPSVTIGNGGPQPFQGTVIPAVTNGFYDVHEAVNTIDVLGTLGLDSCTFTCVQTYSCQGNPIGKFAIQYQLNHGNGVTNVGATKTATN